MGGWLNGNVRAMFGPNRREYIKCRFLRHAHLTTSAMKNNKKTEGNVLRISDNWRHCEVMSYEHRRIKGLSVTNINVVLTEVVPSHIVWCSIKSASSFYLTNNNR